MKIPNHSYMKPLTAVRLFVYFGLFLPLLGRASSGITYHGKILRPDGITPVSSATTQFKIQIRTPGGENCLLWEEQQTKDLSSTNGVFTITINDTAEPSLIANALPFAITRVFSNRSGFTGLTGCSAGTTYNPSTVDGRNLQVSFRENPSDPWEQMPLTKVNFIPLSLNSVQLSGYDASEFLKIDPLSSYTTLTAANVNTLVDIIAGTNSQYLKPSSAFSGDVTGTSSTTVVEKIRGTNVVATAPTTGQILKYDGTNWAPAADDTGGSPADASYTVKGTVQINTDLATSGLFIAAGVLALPNVITAGGPTGGASTVPVITYDQKGRLTAVSTATIDDTTKLPLAGGTMTGSINMGTQNITNATSVAATNFSGRNLILSDNDTNTVTIKTPTDIAADYVLTLPADDGNSGQVLSTDGSGALSWVAAGSALSLTANQAVVANGTGTALSSFTCTVGQVMSFDGAGLPVCGDVTGAGGFVQNGNSFGAAATLGTNDNFDLNFETNGTPKMTVLANGKVGVGTAAPTTQLSIIASGGNTALSAYNYTTPGTSYGAATVVFRDSSGVATHVFDNAGNINLQAKNSGGTSTITFGDTSGGNHAAYITATKLGTSVNSGTLSFRTAANANQLFLDSAGNVGIGTTSPNTALDLNGALSIRGIAAPADSVAGQGRIYFDSTANKFKVSENNGAYVDLVSSGGGISGLTTNYLPKATSATALGDSVIAESSGKIGIGTAAPTVKLDVAGGDVNVDGSSSFLVGTYGAISRDPSNHLRINYTNAATDSNLILYSNNGGTGYERMRIDKNGNVGVGTATPAAKFDVLGDNSTTANAPLAFNVLGGTSTFSGGRGGNITMTGGTGNHGGSLTFAGGTGSPSAGGASLSLIGGVWGGGGGSTTLAGGTGGNGNPGGTVNLVGGNVSSATGGAISLTGATGGGGNNDGGNVTIQGGIKSGSGTDGNVLLSTTRGKVGVGTTSPNTSLDLNGALSIRGMAAPADSVAGQGRIYFDSTANKFKVSENNGTFVDLVSSGGGISGLTVGKIPKATSATAIGDSLIAESGGNIGIATATPTTALELMTGNIFASPANLFKIKNGGASAGVGVGIGFAVEATGGAGTIIGAKIAHIRTGGNSIGDLAFYTNSTGASSGDGSVEKMRILSTGEVGIGTTSPTAKLDVVGQARTTGSGGGAQINGSAAINWNNGNAQSMSVDCATTTFTNMLDAGTYILAVSETGTSTCTFSQAGLTFYFSPANGARTSGQRTVYTFQRIGTDVYVSWVAGFQ
jgi:hypothetical protein